MTSIGLHGSVGVITDRRRNEGLPIMNRRRLRWIAPIAVATIMLAAFQVQGHADEPYIQADTAEIAPADVAESSFYLMQKYGVTEQEAIRRLKAQRDAQKLLDRVREDFPDTFAGLWMDHDNGGSINVSFTDTVAPTSLLRATPDYMKVEVVKAKHSERELRATAERVADQLEPLMPSATTTRNDAVVPVVYFDDRANAVVVETRSATADGQRLMPSPVAAVAAAEGDRVSVVEARGGKWEDKVAILRGSAPPSCYSSLICGSTPMKGGYRLVIPRDTNNEYAACTNGFNMKGSNGWVYTLTAGHCVLGSEHDGGLDYSNHNNVAVGYETWVTWGTFPSDYTLMPYQAGQAGHWIGSNSDNGRWVRSVCTSGLPYPCTTKDFAVTSYYHWEDVRIGWVVCNTGASDTYLTGIPGAKPGTRCGEIDRIIIGAEVANVRGYGFETDSCAMPGDSGGPLFSQIDNRGYGILSGGSDMSTLACEGVYAGVYSTFSSIDTIIDQLNVRTGITMRLAGQP